MSAGWTLQENQTLICGTGIQASQWIHEMVHSKNPRLGWAALVSVAKEVACSDRNRSGVHHVH